MTSKIEDVNNQNQPTDSMWPALFRNIKCPEYVVLATNESEGTCVSSPKGGGIKLGEVFKGTFGSTWEFCMWVRVETPMTITFTP